MEPTQNQAQSEYNLSQEEQVVLTKLLCIKDELKFKVHIMKSLLAVDLEVITPEPQSADQFCQKLQQIKDNLQVIVSEIQVREAANPGLQPAAVPQ